MKSPSNVSELIDDIVAGKTSLLELIASAQDEDYRSHVDAFRLVGLVLNNLEAAKAFSRELQEKISSLDAGIPDQNSIANQLARKDGTRRFEKLMLQRNEAFAGRGSLLSGSDFDTCLMQYKALISYVERLWASAAQEYKLNNFPIAAFLSILVIEEIGKLGHLYLDLLNYDLPKRPASVITVERDHRRKHFIGVISGALINSRLDRILGKHVVKKFLHEAESDELEITRQKCLYIDVKDGIAIIPDEQIGEDRARVLVVAAGELMAEVLGHFPWEFERMLGAVMQFEREIGFSEDKIAQR